VAARGGPTWRRWRRRTAWIGIELSEREERNREKKDPGGRFKRFIFGGQGLATENKILFSVAMSAATETKVFFGGRALAVKKKQGRQKCCTVMLCLKLNSKRIPSSWIPSISISTKPALREIQI
jgi:hypothetical protein